MKNYTPSEIIRGCKKEDPHFQKALVQQYSGLLMGIGKRYTRDSEAAKDLLQDTLIKILKGIPKYKEQGNFEAWMKRILVNTALKQLDKGSFKNELYTIEDTPDKTIGPNVYANMAADELIQIINKLPENYKTIFNLHAVEGFSHKEISEMLNIKESTSRSQLTRARGILKKHLGRREKVNKYYKI